MSVFQAICRESCPDKRGQHHSQPSIDRPHAMQSISYCVTLFILMVWRGKDSMTHSTGSLDDS